MKIHRLKVSEFYRCRWFYGHDVVSYLFGAHIFSFGGRSWRYIHVWPFVVEWEMRP